MNVEVRRQVLAGVDRGILGLLDDETKRLLAESTSVRVHRFGEVVIRSGDPADALHVIVSGAARVVGIDAAGHETTLALLRRRGDVFGERAIVLDQPHLASVRAADDLVLLRLEREDFRRVLAAQPTVMAALRRFVDESGVSDFLKQFTALGALPAHVLRKLVNELEEVPVRAGESVVVEGSIADRFYIVRRGVLDVLRREEAGGERTIGQVAEGESFGELALLAGVARTASVRARTDCELYALGKQSFERILAGSPELRARIEERARSFREASSGEAEGTAPSPLPDVVETPATEAEAPRSRRRPWRRHPFVAQNDETDCAAACLAMITAYHGVPVGQARLRDLANVDADGATLWSVAQAAETLGFHARGLQLSYAALSDIELPAVVHWQGFHYVVLYEVSPRGVLVGDPAVALKRMSADEFRRGWTGRALELRPTERLRKTERLRSPLERWKPILRPHLGLLGEVLIASLLLNVLGLGLPLFTQVVVDRVLVTGSVDLLDVLLAGMVLVVLFQGLIGASRSVMLIHVASRSDGRLLGDYFRHVMALPMRFFDLRRVGDVVSRVSENEKVRAAMVGTIPGIVLDVTLALGYFGLMTWYDVRLTLIVAAVLPLFAGVMLIFTPALRRNRAEQFARRADAWSYLIESVTGMATVKAMAVEQTVRWRLESLFARSIKASRTAAHLATAYGTLASSLQLLAGVVFLWCGARLVLRGELTVGQLLAFTTLAANVLGPMLRLVGAWDELQDVRTAIERLNDVMDARPEEVADRPLLAPARLRGRIRFDAVSFKYVASQDRPTLEAISFEVAPGEQVAVVGRSGSGKSTLGKLILGMYKPTRGSIHVDGHDMRTLSRRALRRRIGVVPQEVFLFTGTIRENIALIDPETPLERIVAAARRAGAHEFVSDLPLGYETKVGERGMTLSGGQRQRIALARALLADPDVLILDEATSALDAQSERAIQRSLEEGRGARTTIVIAHRLSTIQDSDRILVLDGGNVVEQGRHEELIALGGLYASLVGQQVEQ